MATYRVYYHDDSALVTESPYLIATCSTERAARRILREKVGVARCDDSFIPACVGDDAGFVTGADGASGGEGPFGWVERD